MLLNFLWVIILSIKVLVFDKDGTLTDSSLFWKNFSRGVALDILNNLKLSGNDSILADLMEIVGFRNDGSIIPESIVVSGTSNDIIYGWIAYFKNINIVLDRQDLYNRFQRDFRYGSVVPLYDSIPEVFEYYYKKGYKLALATSDNYESCLYCCKELGIERYISVIASKDKVARPKPYPDSMDYICAELSVEPTECIMIGDSANDMIFARNSGCEGIYIKNTAEKPEIARYHIKDIKEIFKIID